MKQITRDELQELIGCPVRYIKDNGRLDWEGILVSVDRHSATIQFNNGQEQAYSHSAFIPPKRDHGMEKIQDRYASGENWAYLRFLTDGEKIDRDRFWMVVSSNGTSGPIYHEESAIDAAREAARKTKKPVYIVKSCRRFEIEQAPVVETAL